MKQNGFTLAETLITIGIIGIIAAITLPIIIANKRAIELETELKKNTSVLQQAILRITLEDGITPSSANLGYRELKQKIKPYLSILKDCGYGTEFGSCVPNTSQEANKDAKNTYKTYNKSRNVDYIYFDDGQLLIFDGSLLLLENADYSRTYISVDVNGYTKGPNVWGQDLFTFAFTKTGKFLPMGAIGTDYADDKIYCSTTSSSSLNGIGCTYKALTEPDYFKKLPR